MAKNPGWRQEPARHALAARGVNTRTGGGGSSISGGLPRLSEPTKIQVAENAIRDMFLSKQYDEKVPCGDVSFILNSQRWYSLYGKEELKEAWDSLVKDGFVHRDGDYWIWEMR